MGKKRAPRLVKFAEKPLRKYLIGYTVNTSLYTQEIECHAISEAGCRINCIIYDKNNESRTIASYLMCTFYREITDITSTIPANVKLPENFGKIDGEIF